MKRLLKVLLILGFVTFLVEIAKAAPLATETPIRAIGTPTTVSVSTSAWTLVPAASSLAGRTGVVVSLPASSNAVMALHFGGCSSTAVATTVRPMELAKGSFVVLPVSPSVCVWALSLHTAAENVQVQEIRQ